MKRNDSTFNEMVGRLQSGEISRIEASEKYGVPLGTLNVWLCRSKVAHTIPRQRLDPGAQEHQRRGLLGKPLDADITEAMGRAVERVVRGEISALAMSREDPRLNHRTIAAKARKARLAIGIPVQSRSPRPPKRPSAQEYPSTPFVGPSKTA